MSTTTAPATTGVRVPILAADLQAGDRLLIDEQIVRATRVVWRDGQVEIHVEGRIMPLVVRGAARVTRWMATDPQPTAAQARLLAELLPAATDGLPVRDLTVNLQALTNAIHNGWVFYIPAGNGRVRAALTPYGQKAALGMTIPPPHKPASVPARQLAPGMRVRLPARGVRRTPGPWFTVGHVEYEASGRNKAPGGYRVFDTDDQPIADGRRFHHGARFETAPETPEETQ